MPSTESMLNTLYYPMLLPTHPFRSFLSLTTLRSSSTALWHGTVSFPTQLHLLAVNLVTIRMPFNTNDLCKISATLPTIFNISRHLPLCMLQNQDPCLGRTLPIPGMIISCFVHKGVFFMTSLFVGGTTILLNAILLVSNIPIRAKCKRMDTRLKIVLCILQFTTDH